MNTWLWLGGGLAAVAAVVAVLYFVGAGAVLSILRTGLGIVADGFQWLRIWLRRPGNKIRAVCLVLAVLAASLGLQSWHRGTVIIQQRADYVLLKERTDREQADLRDKISERDRTIEEFISLANRQKALLKAAQDESREAREEAQRVKDQAAKNQRNYQEEFTRRPPECKAALEVMAAACPSLDGY